MLKEQALNIYTDGSMLPSPRAGGIGIVFVIIDDGGDAKIIKEFETIKGKYHLDVIQPRQTRAPETFT
jgi:ribonuclease HI